MYDDPMTNSVIVLIDDERSFLDGREALVFRDEASAVEGILALDHIDELWLDFNLVGMEDVSQALSSLVRASHKGAALPTIGKVFLHSASATGDSLLKAHLTRLNVTSDQIVRIWNQPEIFTK